MNKTRRRSLISILLTGVAIAAVACGGSVEAPPPDADATDASVETISLKIEGMT